MAILSLWSEYSREEVHSIFSPDTAFTPHAGTWGLQGIVRIPGREGDWVFFVTLGQHQGDYAFNEWVTDEGVLSWKSQPSQRLDNKVIRALIAHDERVNTIHLFLRTDKRDSYTYLGPLRYLTHDKTREAPVHFQWQLKEWPVPTHALSRMRLRLVSSASNEAQELKKMQDDSVRSGWVVSGKTSGEWVQLPVKQRCNEEISGDLAIALVRDLYYGNPPTTIRYLEAELNYARDVGCSIPGLDAVNRWGGELVKSLESDSRYFLTEQGCLAYREERNAQSRQALWDAQTLVVIVVHPGINQIHVAFSADSETCDRDNKLRREVAGSVASYFEWRGYFGSNSAVVKGFQRLKSGFRETCEITCGGAGFIVGTITRIAGGGRYGSDSDEVFNALQDRDSGQWIAKNIADLADESVKSDPSTILVHGTYSTCSSAFKDIPKQLLIERSTIRFEHDTFRSIQDNAATLAKLIVDKFHKTELLLLAGC